MPKILRLGVPWTYLFGWKAAETGRYGQRLDYPPKLRCVDGRYKLTGHRWREAPPAKLEWLGLRDEMDHFAHYQYGTEAILVLMGDLLTNCKPDFPMLRISQM